MVIFLPSVILSQVGKGYCAGINKALVQSLLEQLIFYFFVYFNVIKNLPFTGWMTGDISTYGHSLSDLLEKGIVVCWKYWRPNKDGRYTYVSGLKNMIYLI